MRVTYYYPWNYFYPTRAGADILPSNHLKYFKSRGIRPTVLLRTDNPSKRRYNEFRAHYDWVQDVVVYPVWEHPSVHRMLSQWSLAHYLYAHMAMAGDPRLQEALGKETDLFFSNYVFSAPFTDQLSAGTPKVMESIDLLTYQFLDEKVPRLIRSRYLDMETRMYDLFDGVIMLNHEEAEYVRGRCRTRTTYLAQPFDVVPGEKLRHSDEDGPDLLFVGSGHPPNVEGATWFYENVFRPLLKERGVRWAIAGSVCDRLSLDDPSVQLLGIVPNLTDLYSRSKIVVVPVLRGAGISIKTLEALAHMKPVVATPIGARGLPSCNGQLVRMLPDHPPEEAAERILELVRSAYLRKKYGRKAAAYMKRHFSWDAYCRGMDDFLKSLGMEAGPANGR